MTRLQQANPIQRPSGTNLHGSPPTDRAERIDAWQAGAILVVFITLYIFAGLGQGDLYRNETLRAYIASEMLQSGNWIVPHLYGQPILTKPPGQYWMIAGLSLPLGQVTEWSARLPSALAAAAFIAALFLSLRSMLGLGGALLAAMIMPASWLWLEKAASAEMDMLLTAWVGLAWLAFIQAVTAYENHFASHPARGWLPRHAKGDAWWVLALVCVGCGMLTKWTACIYFYAGVIPFLAWRRQTRLFLSVGHGIGAGLAMSLFVCWFLAVLQQVGWDAFWLSLKAEALPRVLAAEHRGGVWLETFLHPFKVIIVVLPWSLIGCLALHPYYWRHDHATLRRWVQALLCWFGGNLLLFTLLPEHAMRHSFPFTSSLSVLAAFVLWEARHRSWSNPSTLVRPSSLKRFRSLLSSSWVQRQLVWGTILLFVMIKMVQLYIVTPKRDRLRRPSEKAHLLAEQIPSQHVLFIKHVKDEGIMFYLRHPVRRVKNWSELPSQGPVYLLLTEAEYQAFQRQPIRAIRSVSPHKDTQNDMMMLIVLS